MLWIGASNPAIELSTSGCLLAASTSSSFLVVALLRSTTLQLLSLRFYFSVYKFYTHGRPMRIA
jgi:hypothetical protein